MKSEFLTKYLKIPFWIIFFKGENQKNFLEEPEVSLKEKKN